jgi:hypothetical protein
MTRPNIIDVNPSAPTTNVISTTGRFLKMTPSVGSFERAPKPIALTQHDDLGHQVGGAREAGGPLPLVDHPLLDQLPYGVGRAGEARADRQYQHDGARVLVREVVLRGTDAEAAVRRDESAHHAQDGREDEHQADEAAVGGDHRQIAADQCPQLRAPALRLGRALLLEDGRGLRGCGVQVGGVHLVVL